MDKTLNIQLIQDKYTNFMFYVKNECDTNSIDLSTINNFELAFKATNTFIPNNIIYRFDNTKKAYVIAYDDFEAFNYSEYESTGTLNLKINDKEVSISINENITTKEQMIDLLNSKLSIYNVVVISEGEKVIMYTNDIGYDAYIKIIDGTILKHIKWNEGVYRGNDILWNSNLLTYDNFIFTINADEFYLFMEIPETFWEIDYTISYNEANINYTYPNSFIEFTYKQTEIYRAKIFEYISRNMNEFLEVEQRLQTDMELFLQKSIYFDAVYKSFLASIEIGDLTKSNSILEKLKEYKLLNPIL